MVAGVATPYGVSPTATAFTVTGPPIAAGTQMTFVDVDAYVQAAAVDSAGYAADGRAAFLVFLPTGVSCASGGLCSTASAFHRAFGTSTRGQFDAVAVVVRSQGSTMEGMTLTASHEIIESATDPEEDAWKLESADHRLDRQPLGVGRRRKRSKRMRTSAKGRGYLDGGVYYQRMFSNQAAALGGDPCVPAIPMPYFNVTTNGWYSTTTGEVSIPVTGWSVGAVADWGLVWGPGPNRTRSAAADGSDLVS